MNSFADTVAARFPMLVTRATGGSLYLAGALIMAFNLWKTVTTMPEKAPAAMAVPAE